MAKKRNPWDVIGDAVGGAGHSASHAGGGGNSGGGAIGAASGGAASVSGGVGAATGTSTGYSSAAAGVSSVSSGVGTATGTRPTAPSPTYSPYTSRSTTTVNLKPLMSTITDPATRALASSAISAGLKYEVNPSLLIASASVTDYGRAGKGKGYTNLGDGSETGAKSIRQAAKYLSEVGFHTNPQQAISALAKRTGADPEQLRKVASGYTALDEAARKIEHADGDTNVTGVGYFKYRQPGDRPGVRAAINAATKAGQAATKEVQQQAAAERNNPFDTTYEQARRQQRQGDLPAPTAALKARDAGKAATAEVAAMGDVAKAKAQATRNAAQGTAALAQALAGEPAGPNPRKVATRLKKAVAKSQGQVPDYVPEQYRGLIADASSKSGVPTGILSALLQQESGFQAHIGSPAGAQGIAQFMPGTAASRGVDPNDPRSAIPGAADLLAENKAKFGSWELALAAYNAGPGAPGLSQGQIPPYPETQNYVKTIMANAGSTDPAKDVSAKLINKAEDVLGKQRTNKIINAEGGVPSKPLSGADIGKLRGPRDQIEQFKTMLKVAQRIDASGKDYVWGGGHVSGKIPGIGRASGYDCSGFTSKVLQAAGVPGLQAGAITSGQFGSVEGLKPGPGAVSIFYNDSHVFMRIGDKYFGTSSSGAPGGGSTGSGGQMTEEAGASQVNSGEFAVVHVASLDGLKGAKVATKGLKVAPDGTTATLTASQPVGAPGPSSLPPTPNGLLSPKERATVNAAAGVSMPGSAAADYARGSGSLASTAAAYARKSLTGDTTGDPIYDAFRPRR